MERNGSGARFFAVVAKIGNALTQLMNALLITAANGNGQGKFNFRSGVRCQTATIAERCVSRTAGERRREMPWFAFFLFCHP